MNKIAHWLAVELPKYWKTALATIPVVVFVGTEVVQAISDASLDGLSLGDAVRIIVVGGTAYGVYKKQNAPLEP